MPTLVYFLPEEQGLWLLDDPHPLLSLGCQLEAKEIALMDSLWPRRCIVLDAHWAKAGKPLDRSPMTAIGFVLDSVSIPDGEGRIVGIGTFSCVAVELPDGTLEPVAMQHIRFTDKMRDVH